MFLVGTSVIILPGRSKHGASCCGGAGSCLQNDAIRKCSKTWPWMSSKGDFSRYCFEDLPCSKHKSYVLLTPATDKSCFLVELNVKDDDALRRCAGSDPSSGDCRMASCLRCVCSCPVTARSILCFGPRQSFLKSFAGAQAVQGLQISSCSAFG